MRVRTFVVTVFAVAFCSRPLSATNEVSVDFNGYSDSAGVDVLYPSVTLRRDLRPTTEASVRYLVDAITSASMRSQIDVDGITSATTRAHGGPTGSFDEVRHEWAGGVTQEIGSRNTASANLIYGTENDYESVSVALAATRSLAEGNAQIEVGVVRSWDEVTPVTRDWKRSKDTTNWSGSLTQALTRRSILQINVTHTAMNGYLANPYHVVEVIDPAQREVYRLEERHPWTRSRTGVGGSLKLSTGERSSLEFGYRWYGDSWNVGSRTLHGGIHRALGSADPIRLSLGCRVYSQGRAEFFNAFYTGDEAYRSVDGRLDELKSTELELQASMPATMLGWHADEGESPRVSMRLVWYHRKTALPDWHQRSSTLRAVVFGLGFRYSY